MSDVLDDIVKSGLIINPMMLYDLTPLEISNLISGQVEKDRQEIRQKNMRAGVIAAAIYEVNRNRKKRAKPYTWKDIFKDDAPEQKPKQSKNEMKNICKTICKALGGKINGT